MTETVFYIYGLNKFTKEPMKRVHTTDPDKVQSVRLEMSEQGMTSYVVKNKRKRKYHVYSSTSV